MYYLFLLGVHPEDMQQYVDLWPRKFLLMYSYFVFYISSPAKEIYLCPANIFILLGGKRLKKIHVNVYHIRR